MKKKIILSLAIFTTFFSVSTNDISAAGCTPVASNQTTCSGTQTACSQSVPPAGNIRRYCCDTQKDCDDTKAGIQEQIKDKLVPSENIEFPSPVKQDPTCEGNGINTAIGCINFQDTNAFTGLILKWLVGIGGGIAFLLILSASFTIMSSGGNPDRLKSGQELLTSAISGLILLIFSIFILKFIGVDILGLDKFGFGSGNTPAGQSPGGAGLNKIK